MMYLAEVSAENFRVFGSRESGKSLKISFSPGVNAIIGENDGGKTAIIDAIRYCLWTTGQDFHRFTEDDFHYHDGNRASELTIRCKFEGLDTTDAGTFLEWLNLSPDGQPVLFVTIRARRSMTGRSTKISVTAHSGENADGPAIEGMMRELLRSTYLRPLRDAESELSPGRGSRLSQILSSYPEIESQSVDDFDSDTDSATTLVGIVRRAEHHISQNTAVIQAKSQINTAYFSRLQIGDTPLESVVGVASDSNLTRILEKLELAIATPGQVERTRRGLGVNNALFMAAELLLLGSREQYPLLLVEEPEAHLHPQLQSRVIELLNSKASGDDSVQIVLTTHSPILAASISLDSLILVCGGQVFPLGRGKTALSNSDYAFLERFLDSTKANMFFARGVAVVEGDAENILLPALAEKTGFSFSQYGISVVNVGHIGLFRYSKIYQRVGGASIPVRVACIRDLDVAPDGADENMKKGLKWRREYQGDELDAHLATLKNGDGENVRTFVSGHWTLEYDLAVSGWKMAKIMHIAIQSAKSAAARDSRGQWPSDAEIAAVQQTARQEAGAWEAEGSDLETVALGIYRPLRVGNVSKAIAAQYAAGLVAESDLTAADLPNYIIEAFAHLCAQGAE